jgi:ankyrin repeat protein
MTSNMTSNADDSYDYYQIIDRINDTVALGNLLDCTDININVKCENGTTVLETAAYFLGEDEIKFLLQRGADPNIQTPNDVTILHIACQRSTRIAEILIEYGADINAISKYGTVLWWHSCATIDVVELLLNNGADVDLNKNGHTPLYRAAEYKRDDIIELLLENNADIYIKPANCPTFENTEFMRYTNNKNIKYMVLKQRKKKIIPLFILHLSSICDTFDPYVLKDILEYSAV